MSVEYFRFPLKNFSIFKFIILNMITVCCRFSHSVKIMRIPKPGWTEVILPSPDQALCSGSEGEIEIAYIRCIDGREPEFLNFGILMRTELVRFTRMLGFKSATIFGETFYSHSTRS